MSQELVPPTEAEHEAEPRIEGGQVVRGASSQAAAEIHRPNTGHELAHAAAVRPDPAQGT
jgi:hypothetical protein